MFCGAIQSCTTKEKCDVAISEKFPIGMPTRPECPEGQVSVETVYHSVSSLLDNSHKIVPVMNLQRKLHNSIIRLFYTLDVL